MKQRLLKLSSIIAGVAFVGVFYGLAVYNTPGSDAVKATDFKAGRIIDDSVFYNANTMSVTDIQNFLDRNLPACDMWGTGSSAGRVVSETGYRMPAGSTNADYARLRRSAGNTKYHEPPYVCVNKYYENPTTHETLYDTKGVVKSGMISAAQIIYNEAKAYNINPQVLLVLLKKESYVWGDSWPLKWEYNSAMGYGCPDNAPCDTKYYGFYNQMHMAAWQLNYYRQHINSYNYRPYMTNNIYYSPDYSCGTKAVYLENIATTSLYIYTPYTPNDAALRNYPGTSVCGSYGNRNFFMYFSEWFGSTYNISWERMVIPRVLTVKQNTLKLDSRTGAVTNEWNNIGQSNLYTSKISVMRNGNLESCLRTSADEKANKNQCVLLSRLEEYNPTVSQINETKHVAKRYTCKIDLVTMKTNCDTPVEANASIDANATVTVDGTVYYTTLNNKKSGYLTDRFYDNSNISYLTSNKLVSTTRKVSSLTVDGGTIIGEYDAGTGLVAEGEKTIGAREYYVINDASLIKLIDKSATSEKGLVNFSVPRDLIVEKGAKKIDILTGSIKETVRSRTTAHFDAKVFFNGVTYYQASSDSGTLFAIDSVDLTETSSLYEDFVAPRYLYAPRSIKKINIVDGSVCGSLNAGTTQFFDVKAKYNGAIYYSTRGGTIYEISPCAVPASELTES